MLRSIALLGVGVATLACAGCASAVTAGSPATSASAAWTTAVASPISTFASAAPSDNVGLGPPPCPPEPTTEFPWRPRPGGPAPYVVHRGQSVDVGIVLSVERVAHTADLRIDVVPATANVANGAGGGLPLTAGTEPHVLRLRVVDPAPGRYALTFDGLDQAGKPLSDGDYQVYLVTVEGAKRTADRGCEPAWPPTTPRPSAPMPSDALYASNGTMLLGVVRLVG